jgi:hypothetical protein
VARAQFRDTIALRGTNGMLLVPPPGMATAAVYDVGTSNPVGEPIYADDSTTATLANPIPVGSDGLLNFWLAEERELDLLVQASGFASVRTTVTTDSSMQIGTGLVLTGQTLALDVAYTNEIYMRWVPYTGSPQSFLKQDLTRDGDWTMVANKDTSDRPGPTQSGTEEDLLPQWTPATPNARASYTVANQWTLSQAGWIDQYGVDVHPNNLGSLHAVTLTINGTQSDSVTLTPNVAGLTWIDVTPRIVVAGAVIRVSLQVTQVSNQYVYWYEQAGLFATAPVYCSLAQGQKDGATLGTTAYGCHVLLIPGTKSPDWDVVAYGGGGAPGSGGVAWPLLAPNGTAAAPSYAFAAAPDTGFYSVAANQIGISGTLLFGADNTYDIGAAAASRPRNVYVAISVFALNLLAPANNHLNFGANAAASWLVRGIPFTGYTVGSLEPITDNAVDIGGNSGGVARRPRNVYVAGALATGGKAGVAVDGDVINPVDGMLRFDSTNNRLYCRVAGVWRYAALT